METLQQRTAISALERVELFKQGSNKENREKYRTMALKLPSLILTDGLAQALAFVETRGDDAQKALLNDVAITVNWQGADSGPTLADRSRTAVLSEYMALTRRVLSALVWYKRYAESVLTDSTPQTESAAQTEGAEDE